MRTAAWYYVEWSRGEGGAQLYDMRADPHEYRNLASDPKYAGAVAEMKLLLQQERQLTSVLPGRVELS